MPKGFLRHWRILQSVTRQNPQNQSCSCSARHTILKRITNDLTLTRCSFYFVPELPRLTTLPSWDEQSGWLAPSYVWVFSCSTDEQCLEGVLVLLRLCSVYQNKAHRLEPPNLIGVLGHYSRLWQAIRYQNWRHPSTKNLAINKQAGLTT